MKHLFRIITLTFVLVSVGFGATRVAYLRPGPMMKIPLM